MSKNFPIYSSKTCLRVSEHSFEKLETVKTNTKKLALQIDLAEKNSGYDELTENL